VQVNSSVISKKLLHFFAQKDRTGQVFSRFENALNIELEGMFLFNLLPDHLPPNPRSLGLPLSDWEKMKSLSMKPALPVWVGKTFINIPCRKLLVTFDQSRSWNSTPCLPKAPNTEAEIYDNLEIVERGAAGFRQNNSIGCPRDAKYFSGTYEDLFRKHVLQAKKDLILSLSVGNLSDSVRISSQLIGLGQGLTPSGDDVLSGIMAAGVYCGLAYPLLSPFISELNNRIMFSSKNRTTIFSQVFLEDSSQGEVVQPLRELLRGILCRKDQRALLELTRQVLNLGGTSGADMLEGALGGLNVFLKLKRRWSHAGISSDISY
jgi:hypothetical protein